MNCLLHVLIGTWLYILLETCIQCLLIIQLFLRAHCGVVLNVIMLKGPTVMHGITCSLMPEVNNIESAVLLIRQRIHEMLH